ncbi:MAG TPA: hypothetical protein VMU08_08145 [Rhizomicrobium sp.]|nr:hypothetical protein [Rhizomicrobium sp.]
MSLSDLASIGSLVSGVAVVITLIFLLLQMRQTDRNQRASIRMGRASRANNFFALQLSPEVTRVIAKTWTGEALNEVETHTYLYYCAGLLTNWEDTYYQHRAGLLDDAIMESEEAIIRQFAATASFRGAWQFTRVTYSKNFCRYIDRFIEQATLLPPSEIAPFFNAVMKAERSKAKPFDRDSVPAEWVAVLEKIDAAGAADTPA